VGGGVSGMQRWVGGEVVWAGMAHSASLLHSSFASTFLPELRVPAPSTACQKQMEEVVARRQMARAS